MLFPLHAGFEPTLPRWLSAFYSQLIIEQLRQDRIATDIYRMIIYAHYDNNSSYNKCLIITSSFFFIGAHTSVFDSGRRFIV